MKLTSIEIHPDNSSNVVVLSFRDPKNLNSFNVKNITGLDTDALDSRSIAIQVGLNPSFISYSDLRDTIYRLISSSRLGTVQLRFINGSTTIAAISGFVSKVESPQFEKTPDITITIDCPDPLIRALSRKAEAITGLGLGALNIIDNDSTAPHGFIFQMHVLDDMGSITISSPSDPTWEFEIAPGGGFETGDVIFFSSEVNARYIYMVRSGTPIQLADSLVSGASWPFLFPGRNVFGFTNSSELQMDSFDHYPTYWGI